MPEGNSFDESTLNESYKSIDWTIDNVGSLRIYDDDGTWKSCGCDECQQGPQSQMVLSHTLLKMKFDDLINFRTLNFLV